MSRPGFISYQDTLTGNPSYVRPEAILHFRAGCVNGTVITLTDGSVVQSSDKPFAIAERIKAVSGQADPEPNAREKFDRVVDGPNGYPLQVHADRITTGAWLLLGSPPGHVGSTAKGRSLGVVSTRQSGTQNYVVYYDGKANLPRLAVSVEGDGSVNVQVLIPGDSSESSRIRNIALDRILALAAGQEVVPCDPSP